MVDMVGRTCLYFINRCLCREILSLKGRENCSFLVMKFQLVRKKRCPTRKKRRPTRKKIAPTREFASNSDIDNNTLVVRKINVDIDVVDMAEKM